MCEFLNFYGNFLSGQISSSVGIYGLNIVDIRTFWYFKIFYFLS